MSFSILQMANLAGYVIGPSGLSLFVSSFLSKEGMKGQRFSFLVYVLCVNVYPLDIVGLPVLGGVFFSFYVGTKVTNAYKWLFLRFIELDIIVWKLPSANVTFVSFCSWCFTSRTWEVGYIARGSQSKEM